MQAKYAILPGLAALIVGAAWMPAKAAPSC